ncbi:MAG: hypothetical protein JRF65_03015 [Deltaproteobacteria bacterium]|nr:hypothetical protein [Deltaproteobacteria bacterium]MBW2283554.1 hypothetical protein [Deltaproteobacteria bacterium]
MNIPEEHKSLLKQLGLTETDFKHFDGEFVRYEYDEKRGVRIHDPYYTTSYNEYIGIDGWSAWSDENDTFMSDILAGVNERLERVKAKHESAGKDVVEGLKSRFGKKSHDH